MKETAPLWSMQGRSTYSHSENIPGPGAYSPTDSMLLASPKYRVGTAARRGLADLTLTPGPGAYSPSKNSGTPSWTILGRSSLTRSLDCPGPGTYRVVQTQESPRFSVGKAMRSSLENPKFAPGPGAYNPQPLPFKGNNLFGKAERAGIVNKSAVPGPGVYEIKSMIVEGPRFTFRQKLKVREGDRVPGPGNYNPNALVGKEKSPAWGVSKGEKSAEGKDKSLPGPGSYLTKGTFTGPKWGFGSEKRGKSAEIKNPGPGTYEIRSSIGAAPSYVAVPKVN